MTGEDHGPGYLDRLDHEAFEREMTCTWPAPARQPCVLKRAGMRGPIPDGAVLVARPSRWGNPFDVKRYGREGAVQLFEERLQWLLSAVPAAAEEYLAPLRGKNLVCYCHGPNETRPACHADVLLRYANREATGMMTEKERAVRSDIASREDARQGRYMAAERDFQKTFLALQDIVLGEVAECLGISVSEARTRSDNHDVDIRVQVFATHRDGTPFMDLTFGPLDDEGKPKKIIDHPFFHQGALYEATPKAGPPR